MTKSDLKYLIVALLYRFILVMILSYSINSISPEDRTITKLFGFKANDYGYFIPPAEKLYSEGLYSYRDDMPYAGRMPGYAALYLVFRVFASQNTTLVLIILFQTIIGALGAFYLAKSAALIFKHSKAFIIAYILSFLYPVSVFFDYQTITEGLAISLLSLVIYITLINRDNKSLWKTSLVGLMLTWIMFLRPFLGVLIPLWGLYIFFQHYENLLSKFKFGAVFLFPFLILTGLWTYRNYVHFHQFIPMQTPSHISYGKIYSEGWNEIRTLIRTWGGETAYFEPGSEAEWFRNNNSDSKMPVSASFFYNKPFTESDMQNLKTLYLEFLSKPGYDTVIDQKVINLANKHLTVLRTQQNFLDKIKAQILPLRNLTLRYGSAYMPNILKTVYIDKVVRIIFSLSYLCCLFFGIWLLVAKLKIGILLFIPVLSVIIGLLCVSTIFEFRYFLTCMPFLFLMATGGILWFYDKLNHLRIPTAINIS